MMTLIVLGVFAVLIMVGALVVAPSIRKKTGGSISASGNVRVFADSKGTTIESDSGGHATIDGKKYDLKPGESIFIPKKK